MSLPAHESDLLRQMVRQVLQEIVPQTMATSVAGAGEAVTIASDDDLQAFARRIAGAPQAERDAILSGSVRFRLAIGGGAPEVGPASSSGRPGLIPPDEAAPTPGARSSASTDVLRVETGAVTERHVREAAAAGAVLVLGRKAVLTPLARDRARADGVEITREK